MNAPPHSLRSSLLGPRTRLRPGSSGHIESGAGGMPSPEVPVGVSAAWRWLVRLCLPFSQALWPVLPADRMRARCGPCGVLSKPRLHVTKRPFLLGGNNGLIFILNVL